MATTKVETAKLKKNLKMINSRVQILALDINGNKISLPSDLPYDMNAPVIEIGLSEFGDFYIDSLENESRLLNILLVTT